MPRESGDASNISAASEYENEFLYFRPFRVNSLLRASLFDINLMQWEIMSISFCVSAISRIVFLLYCLQPGVQTCYLIRQDVLVCFNYEYYGDFVIFVPEIVYRLCIFYESVVYQFFLFPRTAQQQFPSFICGGMVDNEQPVLHIVSDALALVFVVEPDDFLRIVYDFSVFIPESFWYHSPFDVESYMAVDHNIPLLVKRVRVMYDIRILAEKIFIASGASEQESTLSVICLTTGIKI